MRPLAFVTVIGSAAVVAGAIAAALFMALVLG